MQSAILCLGIYLCGVVEMVTRQAHILEIAGSSPAPAIKLEYAVFAGRCSGDLRWTGSNPVSVSANINLFR